MSRVLRWLILGVLAVEVAILLVPSWRKDLFSCHICRARKEVQTTSFLSWPIARGESISYPGRPNTGHEHDWWRYSYVLGEGFQGWHVARGIACNSSRYRDGSNEP